VVGALAAGGAAYTNSISGTGTTNNTAGYASITVQGATLTDANYTLDSTGANITAVNFTFSGDVSGNTLQLGFNNGAVADCSDADATNAITNGVIPAADVSGGNTSVTCDVSQSTSGANELDVVVTNP
jgi:hypothetical protein